MINGSLSVLKNYVLACDTLNSISLVRYVPELDTFEHLVTAFAFGLSSLIVYDFEGINSNPLYHGNGPPCTR